MAQTLSIAIRRTSNLFHKDSLGIHLQPGRQGQVVMAITPNSVIARDGQIRVGDELVAVNGKAISATTNVGQLMGNDSHLLFTVLRTPHTQHSAVQGEAQLGTIVQGQPAAAPQAQYAAPQPAQPPTQYAAAPPPTYAYPQPAPAPAPVVYQQPPPVVYQQPAPVVYAPPPTTVIYENGGRYGGYGGGYGGYGGGYGGHGGVNPMLAGGLGFGAGLLAGEMMGGFGGDDITVINNGFGDTTIIEENSFW